MNTVRQNFYGTVPPSKMHENPNPVKRIQKDAFRILKCILLGKIAGKNILQNKMLY